MMNLSGSFFIIYWCVDGRYECMRLLLCKSSTGRTVWQLYSTSIWNNKHLPSPHSPLSPPTIRPHLKLQTSLGMGSHFLWYDRRVVFEEYISFSLHILHHSHSVAQGNNNLSTCFWVGLSSIRRVLAGVQPVLLSLGVVVVGKRRWLFVN